MIINDIQRLLADAKPPKYIPQYFIRGDFAGDGADVVEGLADVLGDEFGGEGGCDSFFYSLEGFAGFF